MLAMLSARRGSAASRFVRIALLVVVLQIGSTLVVRGDDRETGCSAATARGASLRLLCFFDATVFGATGGEEGSAGAGLEGGELDLILLSRLGPRWSLLADVSVAAARAVSSDSAPSEVDAGLERLVLKYEYSDPLRLSVGQFHTPIARWRTDHHRPRWLHVAASRPRMVEFDGRFLPGHLLGVMAEGTVWAGGLNLSYGVGLGDGRPGLTTAEGGRDPESDGAAVLALALEPKAARGLRAGVAAYADRLRLPTPVREVDETALAVHLSWTRGINRIIGELATVRHRDPASGARFDSEAFYLEVVYRLPFFRRRMALYNRIEELRIEPQDPVLRVVGGRTAMVGLRYDLLDTVALKAELRRDSARNQRSSTGLLIQTSLVF